MTRFLVWRAQRETVRILSTVDSATLRDLANGGRRDENGTLRPEIGPSTPEGEG